MSCVIQMGIIPCGQIGICSKMSRILGKNELGKVSHIFLEGLNSITYWILNSDLRVQIYGSKPEFVSYSDQVIG